VEAILINPKWNISGFKPARPDGTITTEDFAHLHFSNKLMVDGLVFVWVEKEIISQMIRLMEKQDLTYVENVCWVMLDETKRKGKISFSYIIQRLMRKKLLMSRPHISVTTQITSRSPIKLC